MSHAEKEQLCPRRDLNPGKAMLNVLVTGAKERKVVGGGGRGMKIEKMAKSFHYDKTTLDPPRRIYEG